MVPGLASQAMGYSRAWEAGQRPGLEPHSYWYLPVTLDTQCTSLGPSHSSILGRGGPESSLSIFSRHTGDRASKP